MTKLLGALLLFLGCVAVGLEGRARVKGRARTLSGLLHALTLMENELAARLPPMAELLALLARETSPGVGPFFAKCQAGLGERPFALVWEESIPTLHLQEEESRALGALGPILGRYDGESQRRALERCREELAGCLDRAQGEARRLGKLYTTLGAALGGLLVILLV